MKYYGSVYKGNIDIYDVKKLHESKENQKTGLPDSADLLIFIGKRRG